MSLAFVIWRMGKLEQIHIILQAVYWDIVYFTQDSADMSYDSCLTFSTKIIMMTVPLCLKLLLIQSPAYAACAPSPPHEKPASDELALADKSVHT